MKTKFADISVYQNAPEIIFSFTTNYDILFDHNLIFLTDFMIFQDMKKLAKKINPSPDGIPQILLNKCANSDAFPAKISVDLDFNHL